MGRRHTVRQGECLLSLACESGIPVARIKSHPDNQELMRKREENILLPGDKVSIPEKQTKKEAAETEQRHRFRKALPKAEIRIKIWEFGEPRADEPYYAMIDGERHEGDTALTDEEGLVVCEIPADAKSITVVVGEEEDEYELSLGWIDPVETVTGLHGRLANLGFDPGGVETPYDEESVAAVRDLMQQSKGKQPDRPYRDPDDKILQQALQQEYGS